MTTITLSEAQARLPQLVRQLAPSEEILVVEEGRPVAKLVGQAEPALRPRRPGSARGKLIILEGEDDHLKDCAGSMG